MTVLRHPPGLHPGADRRAREHLGALERRLHVQRLEDRLDDPLRPEEVPLQDAAEPPPLVRNLRALDRQIDMRHLEQLHVVVPHVDVVPGRAEEADRQRRAQDAAAATRAAPAARARSDRDRPAAASTCTPRRARRRRARPRPGGAAAASCVSRPNIACRSGSVAGTSSSRNRATSSTRSMSRRTSRARHDGTDTFQSLVDIEAEPAEPVALLRLGHVEPERLARRTRGETRSPAARADRAAHLRSRPSTRAPASSTSSCDA